MLTAGSRLGSYEVIALLGAGGMGEVYRAHDARLGRDVALKILPQHFASDPERLARFKREAQVLAAITHPNIGAIFGVEESVVDGARVEALVLELVEGQTLAERISQGAIPLEEALPIAKQIAEALEAAHAQGIVHRDLKPANVKITPGGIVKVLDFGLAKLAEPETAASTTAPVAFSISPTITSPAATGLGVVLGTAAYMSPEQAKGRPADKYCDMWAFGAVLYEMLTGRRAFVGEDVGETLAEVIKANVPWDALPPETPPAIRRLLKRCLVKDRRLRIADAGVARLEVDEGLNELRAPAVPTTVPSPRSRWYGLLVPVAAAVVTAAATGFGVWEFARPTPPPAPVPTRFTIELPQDVRLAVSTVQRVAITRDGRRLIYNGIRGLSAQLYVRSLDQLQSQAIPGVEGVMGAVFVSPDGEWVGYNDVREAKFKKVRISGGPPATIFDNPGPGAGGFRGASWGSTGTIVFATTASPALMQVSDAGGTPQPLTKPQNGELHSSPHFLPDGRALLFTISGQGMPDRVAVVRLDDRQPRVLLAGSSPRFAESGHIVFLRERALWAVPFDRDRLAVAGEAVPVLEGIAVAAIANAAVFEIAANGTLVYNPAAGATQVQRTLVWVDRQGREEPVAAPPRAYAYARLSPDGTQLALDIRDQESDIWLWNIARGTLSRFTFERVPDRAPMWSADGRRILFESDRAGSGNLFWQSADGTGKVEQLAEGNLLYPSGVSPDGTRALFTGTQNDVMSVTLDGTRHVEPVVQTPFLERNATVSPDGRWMAYESNASTRPEIYVRPYPNVSTGQWLVSTNGGTRPLWAHSGRELFYLAPDGALMRVALEAGVTWAAGVPTRLFAGPYLDADANALVGRTYDISLDDRRFLMIKDQDARAATGPSLIVVEHWTEELKKLAK
jgi:Tol biopolymer transport system component